MRAKIKFNLTSIVSWFLIFCFNINIHIDCQKIGYESDVLIIGPRIIKTLKPYVFIYTRGMKNPEETMKFEEISNVDGEKNNVTLTCKKVEGVDHFYECILESILLDVNAKAILTASLDMDEKSSHTKQNVEIFKAETKFSTIIQLDNTKYKNGDVVNMRILFINSDGTATDKSQVRNFYVEIRNQTGSVLDRLFEENFTPKVYTCPYNLSNHALEGEHRVHVWTNVNGTSVHDLNNSVFNVENSFTKKFLVESSNPRDHALKVETQRIVRPFANIILKISGVQHKHLFGKIDVVAQVIGYGKEAEFKWTLKKKNISENFVTKFPINTKKDLKLINKIRDYDVNILVKFTEDSTQQTYEEYLNVTIANTDRVQIIMDPDEDFFTPGKKFKMHVYLKDIDGLFLESTHREVFLGVTYIYQQEMCDEINQDLTYEQYVVAGTKKIKKFVATFEVDVPYNATSIEFDAGYDITSSSNVEKTRKKFVVVRSPDVPISRHYVDIKPLENRFKITDEYIRYRIGSKLHSFGTNDPELETFYVLLIGENGETKLEQQTRIKNADEFMMTGIESWMIPSVNMIVIAHSIYGEFIYDALKIVVDPVCKTNISIDLSSNFKRTLNFQTDQPMELRVSINGAYDEQSSVHVMISDESSDYFASENETKLSKLLDDQQQKKKNTPYASERLENRFDKLAHLNAFVMTNAHLTRKDCKRTSQSENIVKRPETISKGTKRQKLSAHQKQPLETILFENIKGSNFLKYEYLHYLNAPKSTKSYLVSGFMFHPVHGLAFAEEKKINVYDNDSTSSNTEEESDLKVVIDDSKNVSTVKNQIDFDEENVTSTEPRSNTTCLSQHPILDCSSTPGWKTKHYGVFIDLRKENEYTQSFLCKFPELSENITKKISATVYGNSLGRILTDTEVFNNSSTEKKHMQLLDKWMSFVVAYKHFFKFDGDAKKRDLLKDQIKNKHQEFKSLFIHELDPHFFKNISSRALDCSKQLTTDIHSTYHEIQSDWSAAYLAKLLILSKNLIYYLGEDISQVLNYVVSKQSTNGSFKDVPHVPYYGSSEIPLTAFVLSVLLKYQKNYEFVSNINNAKEYLTQNSSQPKNNFERAITAYALSLLPKKDKNKQNLSTLLRDLKKSATNYDSQMYWRGDDDDDDDETPLNAIHVETASYALMAYINSNDKNDYEKEILKISKWLLLMTNTNRICFNSHDSDVAIEALGEVSDALKLEELKTNLVVRFYKNNAWSYEFNVNDSNINNVQRKTFKQSPNYIQMNTRGEGLAFAAISCEYFLHDES